MPARRLPISWAEVEPEPGRWSWGRSDAIYGDMAGAGLRPLIVAIGAPCWARLPDPSCSARTAGVPAAEFDSAWAAYVAELAKRYPHALGIEVWNEPNLTHLFPPYPDAVRFTSLLAQAYAAVKSVDAEMPVVSGGLLHIPDTGPRGVSDAEFLAGMYAAGAATSLDAIGAHPYPAADALAGGYPAGEAMEQVLDRLRSVRDAAGQASTPFWITEVGVSTAPAPGDAFGVSDAEQGAELVDVVRAAEADDDIRGLLVHRLVDARAAPASDPLRIVESGFGVFRSDGEPKPAACALSRELGGSLEC